MFNLQASPSLQVPRTITRQVSQNTNLPSYGWPNGTWVTQIYATIKKKSSPAYFQDIKGS